MIIIHWMYACWGHNPKNSQVAGGPFISLNLTQNWHQFWYCGNPAYNQICSYSIFYIMNMLYFKAMVLDPLFLEKQNDSFMQNKFSKATLSCCTLVTFEEMNLRNVFFPPVGGVGGGGEALGLRQAARLIDSPAPIHHWYITFVDISWSVLSILTSLTDQWFFMGSTDTQP